MSKNETTYGLSTVDHNELVIIQKEIRKEYDLVEQTARDAMIRMGGLLDDARKLINDDNQFGEWRKANTPFESKENANKAMLLHRAIQEGAITPKMLESKMGQSHLLELKDAPLSVQNDVEKLLDIGQIPTVKNLRDMKKMAAASTDSTAKDAESSASGSTSTQSKSSDSYQEKKPAIERSPKEEFGDLLAHAMQIIEEDLAPLADELKTVAQKRLNDAQRGEMAANLKKELNKLHKSLKESLEFHEGRD